MKNFFWGIVMMVSCCTTAFAAVEWKQLHVPGSEEYLLIRESKFSEILVGQQFVICTLCVDSSHVSDCRFIVCALDNYVDKDNVVELRFIDGRMEPQQLLLELNEVAGGLRKIFRSFSDAGPLQVQGSNVVLRENVAEDGESFNSEAEEDIDLATQGAYPDESEDE